MPAGGRDPGHRPAQRGQADGGDPGHAGDDIGPGPGGVDDLLGVIGAVFGGDGPAGGGPADRRHLGFQDDLPAMRPQGPGKVLHQQIGVDVQSSRMKRRPVDQCGVQDRDHGQRIRHGNILHFHCFDIDGKSCCQVCRPHQQQPARAKHPAIFARQIGFARPVQRHDRGRPIGFLEHRRRPARGVIPQCAFPLQQGDGPQLRQPGSRRQPGNPAANHQKIDHASSNLSVAGGGVGEKAVSCAYTASLMS